MCRFLLGFMLVCVALRCSAALPAEDESVPNVVERVSPNELQSVIEGSKGRLFLLLSSNDTHCGFCIRANKRFAELATGYAAEGRFLMVQWSPWRSAFTHVLLREQEVTGLPTYFFYLDGVLSGRVDGDYPVEILASKLIEVAVL